MAVIDTVILKEGYKKGCSLSRRETNFDQNHFSYYFLSPLGIVKYDWDLGTQLITK